MIKKISRALVIASPPARQKDETAEYIRLCFKKKRVRVCVQNVLISPVVFIIIEAWLFLEEGTLTAVGYI